MNRDPREIAQRIVALRPKMGGTVGLAAEGDWEKEIAAILAAEMPRWVPCEERKPEHGLPVLAWDGKYCLKATWMGSEWDGYDDEVITHWQPLPSPPKERA